MQSLLSLQEIKTVLLHDYGEVVAQRIVVRINLVAWCLIFVVEPESTSAAPDGDVVRAVIVCDACVGPVAAKHFESYPVQRTTILSHSSEDLRSVNG